MERENLQADQGAPRVLRGSSFNGNTKFARCAFRYWYYSDIASKDWGFRVVISHTSHNPDR